MTGAREVADRVEAAFAATPRRDYLPEAVRHRWPEDRPLPLARGMTNSQPSTVRDMLERLAVPSGARVLDVGSGSGWTTALLAHLCGADGAVLGLEVEPELVDFGARNLQLAQRPWARIEPATPGTLGRPDEGPYDRILVSAMANRMPTELIGQLAPGGVLVAPVNGRMARVHLDADGRPATEFFGRYRFVPLR